MAAGVLGISGAHVQELVEEESRPGIASVTARHRPTEDETVLGGGYKKRLVTLITVQVFRSNFYTESGEVENGRRYLGLGK